MKQCAVVIGNSSSGIIEAPAIGVPTVNIGDRQRGRLRAPSVIDCGPDAWEIVSAISLALSPTHIRLAYSGRLNPPTGGRSAEIKDVLKNFPLDNILFKQFYDLAEET